MELCSAKSSPCALGSTEGEEGLENGKIGAM